MELLPLVYDELRKLAARGWPREGRPDARRDGTRPRGVPAIGGDQRSTAGHFFAAAAEAMRRILVENARRKAAAKHGSDRQREELDGVASPEPDDELLALDEALDRLAEKHPEKAALVKLRYFAGLTADEAAAALGLSPSTADRHWTYARAWLKRAVGG